MNTPLTRATLPHRKDESYKYTNISALLKNYIEPSLTPIVPQVIQGADLCTVHIKDRTIDVWVPRDASVVVIDDITQSEHQQWVSRYLHFHIDNNAALTLVRQMSNKGVITDKIQVDVGTDAQFDLIQVHTGNNVARTEVTVHLDENSRANMTCLNILSYAAHGDFTTRIDHRAPSARSHQHIRNVVSGSSHAVYQGKVRVAQTAQQTTAVQSCKSILLSNAAEVDAKPEFEIYNDDVQCTHGVSNGTLDSDSLFYANARGIPPETAQHMLIRAFVMADFAPALPDAILQKMIAQMDQALIEVTA